MAGLGEWKEISGDPVCTLMHAILLPKTDKVLFWGYNPPTQPPKPPTGDPPNPCGSNPQCGSKIWDYSGTTPDSPGGVYSSAINYPGMLPGFTNNKSNLWSAQHAILDTDKGLVLAHGGFAWTVPQTGIRANSFIFDPTETLSFPSGTATGKWSAVQPTHVDRFYSTTLMIEDGTVLTLFGGTLGSISKSIEIYRHGTGWSEPILLPNSMNQHIFYPWTYLLPDGRLFIAGPHVPAQRFDWHSDPINVENFPTKSGDRSSESEKGTSVMLILNPKVNYRPIVYIMGGNIDKPNTPGTSGTAEQIDLSKPSPSWEYLPNLKVKRPLQFTATLLPDGRVFIAGGTLRPPVDCAKCPIPGGPCEIFDPRKPELGWQLGPNMKYAREYHSAFILLRDGSILAGGDPDLEGSILPGQGVVKPKPTPHERFFPDYFYKPRPTITNLVIDNHIPGKPLHYNEIFHVTTPVPLSITGVVMMMPGTVTHGYNMTQRGVELLMSYGTTPGRFDVGAPPNPRLAPPGWYLLFILDSNRVPSEGVWVRLTPWP